jgi:hypothetical protein
MRPVTLLVGALAAVLCGCATGERISAAGDVHALLIAIRDKDRPAFDARVDKVALDAEFQSMIVDRARSSGAPDFIKGLGVVVSGPLARAAGAALIRPDVFAAIADYYGYRPGTPIPGVIVIASALQALPDGRVCAIAKKSHRCLLTFADEDGVWRLVGFDAGVAAPRLPGA